MRPHRECEELEPLLYDWQLGEVDPEEAARIQSHLTNCLLCAAEVRRWREFHDLLAGQYSPPEHSVVPRLTEQIVQAIRLEAKHSEDQPSAGLLRTMAWPIVAAVMSLPVLYGLLLSGPGRVVGSLRTGEATEVLLASMARWSMADALGWIPILLWPFAGLTICYATFVSVKTVVSRAGRNR